MASKPRPEPVRSGNSEHHGRRTVRYVARVTPEAYEALESRAEERGLTRAELLDELLEKDGGL